jgi:hypothetical protein
MRYENPRARGGLADIIRRLQTVRPEATAKWGRMSAHQMVCHLADSMRMALNQRTTSTATGPLQRTLVKWIALYLPLPWPAGIPTRPEVDQEAGGTRPLTFGSDMENLQSLLRSMTDDHMPTCPTHPIFGPMSRPAWLRWAYLHADHHLRQFGV